VTPITKFSGMSFRFVDLFAGIGGFHHAMHELGGECVFASEIDRAAAAVYARNWGVEPAGDIVPLTSAKMFVPEHDVLCAGFPCQPFSKSGKQRGMEETRGTLFWNIARVLEMRRPEWVMLENVPNIAGPRHTHEWATIIETLRDLGYAVSSDPLIFSPHWLPPALGGTPQVRTRVFIVGRWVGSELAHRMSDMPVLLDKGPVGDWDPNNWDLARHLPIDSDESVSDLDSVRLSGDENRWIDVWNDFLESVDCERLPGFPIWADEFKSVPDIPPGTPRWKAGHLQKNSDFYNAHQHQIDEWKARHGNLEKLPPSRRKLEWQAQDTERDLRNCILQFRPSGIRAKRPTYVPALVAITQTTVVGWKNRKLTVREAARLQGLPDRFDFGDQPLAQSYKQLGNGVAAGAVKYVFETALREYGGEVAEATGFAIGMAAA
jgi:DNA (cytosine-5)-methyltransferase 1